MEFQFHKYLDGGVDKYIIDRIGLIKFLARADNFHEFVAFHLFYDHGIRLSGPQLEICSWLTKPAREKLLIAFRGLGKTYTAKFYAGWRHLRVPELKIKFVSDKDENAEAMAQTYLEFIRSSPILKHLAPTNKERNSTKYNLNSIARHEKEKSVSCAGIESSMTGQRVDLFISDDIESTTNTLTENLRKPVMLKVKEFQSILHQPGRFLKGKDGYLLERQAALDKISSMPERVQILYIGTYQHTQSIWIPRDDAQSQFRNCDRLVIPAMRRDDDNPKAVVIDGLDGKWNTTWPERFTNEELLERRKDGSRFSLDYLCDPSLVNLGARVILLERIQQQIRTDVQYTDVYVDPCQSGKGDEAVAIFGGPTRDGVYVSSLLAWREDTGTWAKALAQACQGKNVQRVYIEAQQPAVINVVQQAFKDARLPCRIERSKTNNVNKLSRIVETLEPCLNSERVYFHPSILADKFTYEQISTITRESLIEPNDRADAMAGFFSVHAKNLGIKLAMQSSRL
jgi:hypothetical protein